MNVNNPLIPLSPNRPTPKNHVVLNVRDVEQSGWFYESFFGALARKRRSVYTNFDLSRPPLKLSLLELPYEEGTGTLSHHGIG